MKNQVLRDYLLHVGPAILIPTGLYLSGEITSSVILFKMMLLFPLMLLAMRGLGVFFPPENIRHRSVGRTVEYAVLQALVFSAFMVMFTDYMQANAQSSLIIVLRQFLITAALMFACNLGLALHTQKKLRSS